MNTELGNDPGNIASTIDEQKDVTESEIKYIRYNDSNFFLKQC